MTIFYIYKMRMTTKLDFQIMTYDVVVKILNILQIIVHDEFCQIILFLKRGKIRFY
jgi:hypothetical protein